MRADRVIGCSRCAKPCALVGDEIPDDAVASAIMLCPWCLSALRPSAFDAWAREEYDQLRRERDDLKAKLDAELPAAWREDLVSLNECLDRVSKERDNKNSERIAAEHRAMVAERERDELKSRLAHAEADAEQAVHNEAFMERQRIAEWLRTASRARGVLISIHSSQDIARCADAIERGEHER